MKLNLMAGVVMLGVLLGPMDQARAALTHAPLTQMVATGSATNVVAGPTNHPIPNDPNAMITELDGISTSLLQVGTTSFSPDPPFRSNQLPEYADEFGLSANASADTQTYLQTLFPRPTNLIFLIEKGGNDDGTMVGLDENGQEVGTPVSFVPGDFNSSLGYVVYEGQQAAGMVITSDTLIRGIRFYAEGIDPVSISSLPVPEPASIAQLLAGIGMLLMRSRRNR
jgi:hypothetical protein